MRTIAKTTLCCLSLIFPLVGSSWACTSFYLDTPDGPIFAANLDLFIPGDGLVFVNRGGIAKENIRQNTTGKTVKWVSKYGSITFSPAGRGFAWSDMNEAGLVLNSLELKASEYAKPDERPPFDIGSLLQYLLDMNAELGGNVEKSFIPYNHDVNLKFFRTLCHRYGNKISEEDAIEIMRLFEKFQCARDEWTSINK